MQGAVTAQATMDKLDPQHFMTGEFLYNDVKAYAAMGEHRTAGEPDRKTSQWLRQQLEGFGFNARLEPVRVRQFFLERAELTLAGGKRVAGFPRRPPLPTGAKPVTSRGGSAGPRFGADVRGAVAAVLLASRGRLT